MLSRRDFDRTALFIYSTDAGLARTVMQACTELAKRKRGAAAMRATLLAASLNDILRTKPEPAVGIENPELPTSEERTSTKRGARSTG